MSRPSEDAPRFCPACGSQLTTRHIDGRERAYCSECGDVIWQNPKPVAWVLVASGGKMLLVKRGEEPDKGTWDIPGGFVEIDESFPDAAIRELDEETAISLSRDDLDIFDTRSFSRRETPVVGTVFIAHADIDSEDISPGEEVIEARLWHAKELTDSAEPIRPVCSDIIEKCEL